MQVSFMWHLEKEQHNFSHLTQMEEQSFLVQGPSLNHICQCMSNHLLQPNKHIQHTHGTTNNKHLKISAYFAPAGYICWGSGKKNAKENHGNHLKKQSLGPKSIFTSKKPEGIPVPPLRHPTSSLNVVVSRVKRSGGFRRQTCMYW